MRHIRMTNWNLANTANSPHHFDLYPPGAERRRGTRGHVPPNTKFGGHKWPCAPPPIKWKYGYKGIFSGAEGAGKNFLPLSTTYNGHFWKMCPSLQFFWLAPPLPPLCKWGSKRVSFSVPSCPPLKRESMEMPDCAHICVFVLFALNLRIEILMYD